MTRKTAQAGTATLFADDAAPATKQPIVKTQPAKRRQEVTTAQPRRNQVAKTEPVPINMLSMLAQLAADPRVQPDKMQAILNIQKEMRAEEARRAFIAAKIRMRPELPIIDARGRIKIESKGGKAGQNTAYAKFFDLNQAIKPVLDKHGFDLWFEPAAAGTEGRLQLIGHLDHVEGHSVICTIPLTVEAGGSKNNVQGIGSSLSYGKRYATVLMLNLDSKAAPEIDDDGVAAGKMIADNRAAGTDEEIKGLTKKQVADLKAAIEDCGVGTETFCGKYEIDSVEELPPKLLGEAMTACRNFKANRAASAKVQNG